jgi:hypothetical protein
MSTWEGQLQMSGRVVGRMLWAYRVVPSIRGLPYAASEACPTPDCSRALENGRIQLQLGHLQDSMQRTDLRSLTESVGCATCSICRRNLEKAFDLD